MAIKKGDLVVVDFVKVERMSFVEVQQELFSSLNNLNEKDYLIVVAAPYEHNHPMLGQTSGRNGVFVYNALSICVDLLLGDKVFKSVPIKYLKRVTP